MEPIIVSFTSIDGSLGVMAKQLDDRQIANQALTALRRRPRRLTLPDGTTMHLPETAVDGLIEMLDAIAHGENATVVRSPREVTTQQAATVLNVSRPTVVRLIEEGELPARKVGSHRRILLRDLLTFRDKIVAERRAALEEMTRDAEDLGLYD